MSTTTTEEKRYVKITPIGLNASLIEPLDGSLKWIENHLGDMDEGQGYTLEVVKMTEAEYNDLDEFRGF